MSWVLIAFWGGSDFIIEGAGYTYAVNIRVHVFFLRVVGFQGYRDWGLGFRSRSSVLVLRCEALI